MLAPHPNQNQCHHLIDAMKGNSARPADTPPNTTTYSGLWEKMIMKDKLPDASRKAQLKNHQCCPKLLNPDLFIPACKGDCGVGLSRFLAGGPKLIYCNK